MDAHSRLFFIFLVATALPLGSLPSQDFSWRINSEMGYFNNTGRSTVAANHLFNRLEGWLNLIQKGKKRSYRLSGSVRPDVYTGSGTAIAWKISGDGEHLYKFSKVNVLSFVSFRYFTYNFQPRPIRLAIFQLGNSVQWYYTSRRWLEWSIYYYFRDLNTRFGNQMDALSTEINWFRSAFKYGRLGAGWNVERFVIHSPWSENESRTSNNGWRTGATFYMEYKRGFLFQFTYRILAHRSDVIEPPTPEHWIQLLWGRLLGQRWSLFFLLNYTYRKLTRVEENDQLIVYSPINVENRIYARLDYEFTDSLTGYARMGYNRDDFIIQNLYLSGWQGVLGVEVRL